MDFLRKLLWPVVPFYYLGALAIKKLYDWGIYKSTTYKFPVITVGNLSVGGTGKSPFVAYLLEMYSAKKEVTTLSRGYKRATQGFQLVTAENTALDVGDEPLQFKLSFPKVTVAVDADRRGGIAQLVTLKGTPELLILDDAFQHRKVKAGFQILLTAYYNLYTDDYMLPAGDLREPISAADRANVIIVTKCPLDLSEEAQRKIRTKLRPKTYQKVYFTAIKYANEVRAVSKTVSFAEFIQQDFCLVTGIAEPKPLVDYLQNSSARFTHLNFADHHVFTEKEIDKIALHKRILTTEKDFMRLQHIAKLKDKLYYLPITIAFLDNEADFKAEVKAFVGD